MIRFTEVQLVCVLKTWHLGRIHQTPPQAHSHQSQAACQGPAWTAQPATQAPAPCTCGPSQSCLSSISAAVPHADCGHPRVFVPERGAQQRAVPVTSPCVGALCPNRWKLLKVPCRVSHLFEVPSLNNYFQKVAKSQNVYST